MTDKEPGRRLVNQDVGEMSAAFVMMENVLERLKLLSYERHFVHERQQKPVGREHFAIRGANTSLQFSHFLDLASWLLTLINDNPDSFQIDQFDDPNTSVHKLMVALREHGFESDFPATRLKHGFGPAVVTTLDFLAKKAVEAKYLSFLEPKHVEEEDDDEICEEQDDDDIVDESDFFYYDGDDTEGKKGVETKEGDEDDVNIQDLDNQILESCVDPVQWRAELERVLPRLRASGKRPDGGWRDHMKQTQQHMKKLTDEFPPMEAHMMKVHKGVADAVDQMNTKEKYLNDRFVNLTEDYTEARQAKTILEERHEKASAAVNDLTSSLNSIETKFDEVKRELDSRSTGTTDTSPLVNLKSTLQETKVEIKKYDSHLGLMNWALLEAMRASRHAPPIVSGSDDDLDEDSSSEEDC